MSFYLVTGGAGFIGSNLARKLLCDGHEVLLLDNLSTGSLKNIPKESICIQGSLVGEINSIKIKAPDGIFHLGIPSSTPLYRSNRYLVGKAISEFISLFEYAKQNNVKVVYASSSSVYNGCSVPWKEGIELLPTDFYSEVRISFERLTKVYYDLYNVKSIGLRMFSVYGPHEEYKKQYANLITQLLWAKLKDETFEIYGNGEQRRDVVYVDDIIKAFIMSMNSNIEYGIFNIGTGINYNINAIAKKIGAKIKYIPVPFKNYVDVTLADTSKTKKELGFSTSISLDEGLEKLKKYYEEEISWK